MNETIFPSAESLENAPKKFNKQNFFKRELRQVGTLVLGGLLGASAAHELVEEKYKTALAEEKEKSEQLAADLEKERDKIKESAETNIIENEKFAIIDGQVYELEGDTTEIALRVKFGDAEHNVSIEIPTSYKNLLNEKGELNLEQFVTPNTTQNKIEYRIKTTSEFYYDLSLVPTVRGIEITRSRYRSDGTHASTNTFYVPLGRLSTPELPKRKPKSAPESETYALNDEEYSDT